MRTKLVYSVLIACTLLFSSSAFADETGIAMAPASAESAAPAQAKASGPADDGHAEVAAPIPQKPSCVGLFVLGYQGNYPRQDFGNLASSKSVDQNMLAATCDVSKWNFLGLKRLTVDEWNSTQLTGGRYGHRGGGDEHDGELTGDCVTVWGMNCEVYVAYYALDLGKGLGNNADDFVETYGELSKPFKVGSVTVTPFARYTHLFSTSSFLSSFDSLRTGGRFDFAPFSLPVIGKVATHVEIVNSWNYSPASVEHGDVWRGELDFIHALNTKWSLTLGAKYTQFEGLTPLAKLALAIF